MLSGSCDSTLKIWEMSTGQLVQTLQGHSAPVWSCAFSPDGYRVVSAAGAAGKDDNTVIIWKTTRQTAVQHTLRGHTALVSSCCFSPDVGGRHVLSASHDGTVRIWSAFTAEAVAVLSGHASRVLAVAWSPDGKTIVSGGDEGALKVWDAETHKCKATVGSPSALPVRAVAISNDSRLIASGGSDGSLRVFVRANATARPTNVKSVGPHTSSVLLMSSLTRVNFI